MALDRDFADLMVDTAQIAPYLGLDKDGATQYGPAASYVCRVAKTYKRVATTDGRDIVASTVIYLYDLGGNTLGPLDKVTLPDGRSAPILSIKDFPNQYGDHFLVEVLC